MMSFAEKSRNYSNSEKNNIEKWPLIWGVLLLIFASAWAVIIVLHEPSVHNLLTKQLNENGQHDHISGHLRHGFMATLLLWIFMVPAMMLPSAIPLIKNYIDIAHTAKQKQIFILYVIIPPLFLICGYMIAWMMFALPAAFLQYSLNQYFAHIITSHITTGFLLLAAAIWQLSPLKRICAVKCKTGFPFILGGWSDKAMRVCAIGFRYGMWCIGCCWALMLLMFAAGIMSLIIMALLTLIMAVEHLFLHKKWQSHFIGVGLMICAFYFIFKGFTLA